MQTMEVHLTGPKGIISKIEYEGAVLLRTALPHPDNENYLFLRYIDPYDRTVFNSYQMTPLLAELGKIILEQEQETDACLILKKLQSMAIQGLELEGHYLLFMGD